MVFLLLGQRLKLPKVDKPAYLIKNTNTYSKRLFSNTFPYLANACTNFN